MVTLYVRATKREVKAVVRSLVDSLTGRGVAAQELAEGIQLRVGLTALQFIQEAFVQKARGGTDAAGEQWQPLAESTVRGRREGKDTGNVEILRDTGRLLNSLTPGMVSEDQVLRVGPGEVIVGTNVKKGEAPYPAFHHEGIPGRLPQRRLWPEPGKWPAAWWRQIGEAARSGVVDALIHLLRGLSV